MGESQVVITLRKFREQMDARDERLMSMLGRRWIEMEKELQSAMEALAEEMARRSAEETITEQLVRRSERFESLRKQMEEQAASFAEDAARIIADAQADALEAGMQSARFAISASASAAYGITFNRLNISAVEAMIGFAGDGSPLWTLLLKDFGAAVDGLIRALVTGVATGQGVNKIIRAMIDGFGMGLDRAILIARTETQRAYRMGAAAQYRESGVVTGFMRLVKKEGACLGCLLLDGETFELKDEMDDHPNGRCVAVPIVRGVDPPEWEKGPEWLKKQSEEKQRAIMGDKRYELWKSGVPLEDMASKVHDDVWGDSPRPTPVSQLSVISDQ
jgi:hypothetical protein